MNTIRAATALLFAMAATTFGQGGLSPSGGPAPSMKSLQDIWSRLDGLSASNQWTGFAIIEPTSAGGTARSNIVIQVGKTVKLESITVNTFSDTNCVVYVRWLVKYSDSVSRIMTRMVSLGTAINDPVAGTRTGTLELPMWIHGGSAFDVKTNEVHSFSVNVDSSPGNTANAAWVLTGYYATP